MSKMSKERERGQPLVVAGDIDGNFDKALNKLGSVANAVGNGKDVVVIVVGDFFTKNYEPLRRYIKQEKRVPVHIYTLGPLNQEQDWFIREHGVEDRLCDNITCFDKYGTFHTSHGALIAYLSGTEGPSGTGWNFTKEDVTKLIEQCKRYRVIDILLTNQWPTSIEKSALKPVAFSPHSHSKLIGELVVAIKPTLHFAAGNQISFTSPVMAHKSDDCQAWRTQFIGLTSFSKYRVGKWVSALNFDIAANPATPQVEIPFDYLGKSHVVINQIRFDTQTHKRKGKGDRQGDSKKRRLVEIRPSDCWFCLGNDKVDNSLIIAIGENAYLTLAKGQINENHVIVLPVSHIANIKDEPLVASEIKRFLSSLGNYFDQSGQRLVYFERCYRSPHAQFECLPVDRSAVPLSEVEDGLKALALSKNLELERVNLEDEGDFRVRAGPQYFYMQIGKRVAYLIRILQDGEFPINFGREVMCNVLNVPDKIRWQNCVDDEETVSLKLRAFRAGFASFNFTLED